MLQVHVIILVVDSIFVFALIIFSRACCSGTCTYALKLSHHSSTMHAFEVRTVVGSLSTEVAHLIQKKFNSRQQKYYLENTNDKCCYLLLLNRHHTLNLHLESKYVLGGKYFK